MRVIALRHASEDGKLTHATQIYSVYIQNLEERVKPEPLTEALRTIFSEFGQVIDVVVKTNLKAKGQAFVVLDSPAGAQEAVDEINGFPLFDKPMRMAMAKSRSDKTIELHGSTEELEAHKQHRLAEKGSPPLRR